MPKEKSHADERTIPTHHQPPRTTYDKDADTAQRPSHHEGGFYREHTRLRKDAHNNQVKTLRKGIRNEMKPQGCPAEHKSASRQHSPHNSQSRSHRPRGIEMRDHTLDVPPVLSPEKCCTAFYPSVLQSGKGMQRSSIDDLLGIDSMDMYNQIMKEHTFVPGTCLNKAWDTDGSDNNGNTHLIHSFQRNCIRALASMINFPQTVRPILVGLFTRGKMLDETVYLQALSEELTTVSSRVPPGLHVKEGRFPMCASILPLLILVIVAYVLGLTLSWQLGLAVAVTAVAVYFIVCVSVYIKSRNNKNGASCHLVETLSRYARGCNLLLNIIFHRPPSRASTSEPVRLLPISLNLSDYSGAIDATASLVDKLWSVIEQKYGQAAVRLQWASGDSFETGPQCFRRFCCLPTWIWLAVFLISGLISSTLFMLNSPNSLVYIESSDHVYGSMIAFAVLCFLSCFIVCLTLVSPIIQLIQGRPFQRSSQRKRILSAGRNFEQQIANCSFGFRIDPGLCLNGCRSKNAHQTDLRVPTLPRNSSMGATSETGVTSTAAETDPHGIAPNDVDIESQQSSPIGSDSEKWNSSSGISNDSEEAPEQMKANKKPFESEELLIHKKVKTGVRNPRNTRTDYEQSFTKIKKILRKSLREAFKVLSILDFRMRDRQTRIILCITHSGLSSNKAPYDHLVTFVSFVRLIDRFLLHQVEDLNPRVTKSKTSKYKKFTNGIDASLNQPHPNIIVILSTPVPYCKNAPSFLPGSLADVQKDLGFLEKRTSRYLLPWNSFRTWWSIHHLCHLPIYLEDFPPCREVITSDVHGMPRHGLPPKSQNPKNPIRGLHNLFLDDHELADLNKHCLRHLTARFEFLGRLLQLEKFSTEPRGSLHHFIAEPMAPSSLVTWLCLLQHWPFHAAWLAQFLEKHFATITREIPGMNDATKTGTERIGWTSDLSHLHTCVLQRLAPAIEATKQLYIESMRGALLSFEDKQASQRVMSTLEICDLALHDHSPSRLAEFLRKPGTDRKQKNVSKYGKQFPQAGSTPLIDLIRLVRLTPFFNPQIMEWMKDISNFNQFGRSNRSSLSSGKPRVRKRCFSTTKLQRAEIQSEKSPQLRLLDDCPVKLNNALPNKSLEQMTVDDVCEILRNIADLSTNRKRRKDHVRRSKSYGAQTTSSSDTESLINDPKPPASICVRSRRLERKRQIRNSYEERIKNLNITGNVLTICTLDELQKELAMPFGDWKLFSALIYYLRNKQEKKIKASRTRSQSPDSVHEGSHKKRPNETTATVKQASTRVIGTASDASLATTIKSAPLSEPDMRHIGAYTSYLPHTTVTSKSVTLGRYFHPNRQTSNKMHSMYNRRQQSTLFDDSKPRAYLCPMHWKYFQRYHGQQNKSATNIGTIKSQPLHYYPQDKPNSIPYMASRYPNCFPVIDDHLQEKHRNARVFQPHGLPSSVMHFEETGTLETVSKHPFPLRTNEETSSTSIAGELVDEIVELTPTHSAAYCTGHHLTQDNDVSTDLAQFQQTPDHKCNCNYWFSLEKISNNDQCAFGTYTNEQPQFDASVPRDTIVVYDMENSLSDSLSTSNVHSGNSTQDSSGTISGDSSTELVEN